ncbi:MAG TPA: DUF202 domain-containing protein [Streptosporangiaceae bacterium]|nr:DUF202 domain-containing protein [Streptosporangiaceae bacterium]
MPAFRAPDLSIIAVAAGPDREPATSTEPAVTEPDARFTLANERTFLAWSRTSLALVAAGLAIAQLLPPFPHVPWGRAVIATPLILLGAVLSAASFFEWKRNQRALRFGGPMPHTHLPTVLAWAVGTIALVATAVELYSKAAAH